MAASGAAPAAPRGALAFLRARKAQLGDMFSKYGYLTVSTYLGVYVLTLGTLYAAVKAKVVPVPRDVNAWLNHWAVKRALLGDAYQVHVPPWCVDFATAWVLTKTTEPLRLVTTIALVPTLVRRLPPLVVDKFARFSLKQALGWRGAAAAV